MPCPRAGAPASLLLPMKIRLFLDVDGVLLGRPRDGAGTYQLAQHALPFLRFAIDAFDVQWATTHCRDGDPGHVVEYLAEHCIPEDRDQVVQLARLVKPSAFNVLKTELIAECAHEDWLWLDDAPMQAEREFLAERGWLWRWFRVDTCLLADDLLRARRWLECALVEHGSQSAGGAAPAPV